MCDIQGSVKGDRIGGKTIPVADSVGTILVHDITEIRQGEFKGRAFRKGHVIRQEDVCHLQRLGKENLCVLEIAEDEMHEETNDDAEHHRADRTGDAEAGTEDARGEDDGQHVDGRARVEERRRRAEPGAALVDAGEERQHRARADRQDGARDGGHRVRHPLAGARAQVAQHRRLADEQPDGPGDEERRHQAEQHVLARVPVAEDEALAHRVPQPRAVHGQEPEQGEGAEDEPELGALPHANNSAR